MTDQLPDTVEIAKPLTKAESDQRLVDSLAGQHPVHGMLGRVYQRIGGEDFVADWAEMYPGQYMKLLVGTTPGMQPMSPFQGDVHLHVHPALAPSPLDEPYIDAEVVNDED